MGDRSNACFFSKQIIEGFAENAGQCNRTADRLFTYSGRPEKISLGIDSGKEFYGEGFFQSAERIVRARFEQ